MTTTTHPKLSIVTALRDKARSTEHPEEAEACMTKARNLCEKYGIDPSILDAPTETIQNRQINLFGEKFTAPERRYPCTFGCGTYTQHTIDDLKACAERARQRNNGDAYADAKKQHAEQKKQRAEEKRQYWEQFYQSSNTGYYYGEAGMYSDPSTGWGGTGRRSRARSHPSGEQPRYSETKVNKDGTPRRKNTSHANCGHPLTKDARARCRAQGGPFA